MAGPCSADFERLAQELGEFACAGQNAVVNLHNPFGLDHWTMLVIEVATVVGAGLALRHAIRRRRAGDPTGLALWIAALVYLVMVEPALYFPQNFGLDEHVGLIFVHNEFTFQFLWGRLPLYIIAIYPVLAFMTYELVRFAGVFERRGPVASALTVGFVYHVFYEIFDHVGPQLRWWIWNPTAPTNEPLLASVPISSMVNFAVAGPAAFAFLVLVLVGRRARQDATPMTSKTLIGRSALVGILMPLGLVLGGMPATVFTFGEEINRTGQAWAYWGILAVSGVVGVHALLDAYRSRTTEPDDADSRSYLRIHVSIFLGALAIAWAAALPEYLGATDGITTSGTPIGSLPYAVGCSVFVAGILRVAFARRATIDVTDPAPVPEAVSV